MIDMTLTIPDNGVVGISVRVQEYTGEVVDTLKSVVDVNRLAAYAFMDPARYPLLAGVDEYDDTYFNSRQAERLIAELKALAVEHPDEKVTEAAAPVIALAELLRAAPGRPHHRQLVFIGD
ncbi:hypothetical protein BJY16_005729 [Actinoplanes octamycinicus]|uniref:Uncharacterized protein n=1 Tax=Actinoplanes octamycinicus TaxID=135948 RepID=A0A7W7H1I6_9ACTN|nr:hypothetical protein [Actinoplanes octamycinicus]MBB4742270.1 hypothetical protein [Actinoplanes octamycinicus]GIE59886.1 hypothetical protein Aoc01nite_52880 [Actinoplanes octamycinicus]